MDYILFTVNWQAGTIRMSSLAWNSNYFIFMYVWYMGQHIEISKRRYWIKFI